MTRACITDVIIDSSDPERLAEFRSVLLDRGIAGRKGPYVWLEETSGEVNVSFQLVADPPAGRGRTHIDLSVPDVLEAADRAEALGGRRASGFEDGGFLVMEDPDGNVFCIIPDAPFDFDDAGRADYLNPVDERRR